MLQACGVVQRGQLLAFPHFYVLEQGIGPGTQILIETSLLREKVLPRLEVDQRSKVSGQWS